MTSAVNPGAVVSRCRALLAYVVVVATVTAGCSSDPEEPAPPQPTRTTTASKLTSPECLKRQQRGYWDVHYRLQVLVTRVVKNPDVDPTRPLDKLRRRVESLGARIDSACGGLPAEWAAFEEAGAGLDEASVDTGLLREAARRFEAWGASVDRSAPRILVQSDPCPTFRRRVSVEYTEKYRPTPWGQRAWVELTVDNRWWSEVSGMQIGTYSASGVLPDAGTRTFRFGGSSADFIGARAGRSSTSYADPGEGGTPMLRLTSWGQISDVRFRPLYLYWQGGTGDCRVPVQRAGG